jgi:hypothetical protein
MEIASQLRERGALDEKNASSQQPYTEVQGALFLRTMEYDGLSILTFIALGLLRDTPTTLWVR